MFDVGLFFKLTPTTFGWHTKQFPFFFLNTCKPVLFSNYCCSAKDFFFKLFHSVNNLTWIHNQCVLLCVCVCMCLCNIVAKVMSSLFGKVVSADWFVLCKIYLSPQSEQRLKYAGTFQLLAGFVQRAHTISLWPIHHSALWNHFLRIKNQSHHVSSR